MRVLVAPDSFTGTLSASEAAAAIQQGWQRAAPGDVVDLAPMSDGGPGFLDALAAGLAGELVAVTVTGPHGRSVPAALLLHQETAYVETAQAAGLHLMTAAERRPGLTTTYGVGALLRAALDLRVDRIVVGLGGSGTNDGGAGMLTALGVQLLDAAGERLPAGGAALAGVDAVTGRPDPRLATVELIAATDVDNPLLGLTGASATYGPQKGATRDDVAVLDQALNRWAQVLTRDLGLDPRLADSPGAGAAGGLGFGLFAVGARRDPGIATVMAAVGLPARIAQADLVLTGEGSFDWQSLRGKVPAGVAAAAAQAAVPCVVLAGRVSVGRREAAAAGVEAAYAVVDLVATGGPPDVDLAALAERVARTWSPTGR